MIALLVRLLIQSGLLVGTIQLAVGQFNTGTGFGPLVWLCVGPLQASRPVVWTIGSLVPSLLSPKDILPRRQLSFQPSSPFPP